MSVAASGTANRRPLTALVTAEAFSITGTRLSTIAIPWLVLTTTGSPIWTGVVAFAEMAPYVVVKALGGPVIDRFGARRVALGCDALSVPVLLLVPLLHLLGALHVATLIPVVALLGALRGPSDSAKYALAPDLAEVAQVPLERATGLIGAVERLGTTIGAVAAGAVVAAFGPVAALGVNALAFVVALALLLVGVPAAGSTTSLNDEAKEDGLSYLAQLRQGWAFLRGDAVLVGITTMVSLTNLLDQAFTVVLLPVWAERSGGGAAAIGLVFAVFAAASIAGALIASARADRLPRLPVYVIAFLLTGLPRFAALGLGAPLWLLVVVLAVGGFASGFINPILGAVIFERIPKRLRGRVSSLNTALCWSLIPFGGLLGGVVISVVGDRAGFLVIGAVYTLVTLMPLAHPGFREFSARPRSSRPGVDTAA